MRHNLEARTGTGRILEPRHAMLELTEYAVRWAQDWELELGTGPASRPCGGTDSGWAWHHSAWDARRLELIRTVGSWYYLHSRN